MGMVNQLFIGLNKLQIKHKKKTKVQPDKIILVFSHCLQNSECPNKIVLDLANCQRCGKCVVKNILELSEDYGIRCAVASGGQMALEKVKKSGAEVVIAIACDKELHCGIQGIFPTPVAAISHRQPKGPCKDCVVDIKEIEQALESLCAHPTLKKS